jgi:hypothetical protein
MEQGRCCPVTKKYISMQIESQNIDKLILSIQFITKNRCSLLESDIEVLNEAILLLEKLKKVDRSDKIANVLLVVKVIDLIRKFFL